MKLSRQIYLSPIGPIDLLCNKNNLLAIRLEKASPNQKSWHLFECASKEAICPLNKKAFDNYFLHGKALNLPFETYGHTLFTEKVLGEMSKIPLGSTKTYGQIAKLIGHPKASQVVGQVCKNNLLPLLIPCHRVVSSSGSIGGFNGGVETKQWLLNHEMGQNA